MVSFDATLPGTSAGSWDPVTDAAPRFSLDGYSELLVVAAHPDDETLGAAGLLAAFSDRGRAVHVLVVTDGAASHPESPTTTPAQLASLREMECRAALAVLAPRATLQFLRYPDGGTRENSEAIARDVAAAIERTPVTALVAAPWRGDGHRDHRVVGEACARAVGRRALLEYPIWMWHWATPEGELPELVSIEIDPGRKAEAIGAHRSQVAALSDAPGDEAMLRPDFLPHFQRSREVFVAPTRAMPPEYFDELYAKRPDPWRLETRWYESRKRAVTMASLPEPRYGRALEIGCSIGMLTAELEHRCDAVLALDVSEAAVEAARRRTGPTVTVERADVTSGLPPGPFDLIVLSEVGYYLTAEALDALVGEAVERLSPGGTFLACHWRHPVDDYLQSGDGVHEVIARRAGLTRLARHEEKDFLLDVYGVDHRSVGEREGLA